MEMTTKFFRLAQSYGVQEAAEGTKTAVSHLCRLVQAHENKKGFVVKGGEELTISLFIKQLATKHADEGMAAMKEILECALQEAHTPFASVLDEVSLKHLCLKLSTAYTESKKVPFMDNQEMGIIFPALLRAAEKIVAGSTACTC